MLIRLTSEQILKYWPSMEGAINASLPQEELLDDIAMLQLQSRCCLGELQVWVVYQIVADDSGQDHVVTMAICVTSIVRGVGTGVSELLIYALCSYENVPMDVWKDAYQSLIKFAKSKECAAVTALTRSPRVLQMVKAMGGDTSTILCRMEV